MAQSNFRLRDIHDRTDRACIGTDTELFFVGGDDPELLEPARERCRRCPIVGGCLVYALTHDVDGIWGGTTPREREEIRAANQITNVEPVTAAGRAALNPHRSRRPSPATTTTAPPEPTTGRTDRLPIGA
jgi:WhiB family redox-sensing transcriptional regulator